MAGGSDDTHQAAQDVNDLEVRVHTDADIRAWLDVLAVKVVAGQAESPADGSAGGQRLPLFEDTSIWYCAPRACTRYRIPVTTKNLVRAVRAFIRACKTWRTMS